MASSASASSDFSTFENLSQLEKHPPLYPSSILPPPAPSAAVSHTEPPVQPYNDSNYYTQPPYYYPATSAGGPNFGNGFLVQTMYDKIQLPLLISVIYFLIQLPFVDHILNLFGLQPYCIKEDGASTTEGHIIKSIIMGGLFYAAHTALISS